MNKKCITCGGQMNHTEKELAKRFLKDFNENGVKRYVWRLNQQSNWSFGRYDAFKNALPQITKNKKNGAEYFSIQEFKAD